MEQRQGVAYSNVLILCRVPPIRRGTLQPSRGGVEGFGGLLCEQLIAGSFQPDQTNTMTYHMYHHVHRGVSLHVARYPIHELSVLSCRNNHGKSSANLNGERKVMNYL